MFITSEQLTEEQRVQKAVISIMQNPKYVALAGILMLGEREVVDADQWQYGLPTACTNGRDEWYHRDFIAKLNDAELRFLILHECYHKLYKHLITWAWIQKEDPTRQIYARTWLSTVRYVTTTKMVLLQ